LTYLNNVLTLKIIIQILEMKNYTKKIYTTLLLLACFTTFSQYNSLGINFASTIFRLTPEIQYQRYIPENKLSLGINFGYSLPRYRNLDSSSITITGIGDPDKYNIDRIYKTGFRITPNVRLYFKDLMGETKSSGYVEFFSRYFRITHSTTGLEYQLNGSTEYFSVKAHRSALTFGAAIGTKYKISENLSIDCLWFGAALGLGRIQWQLRSSDPEIPWGDVNKEVNTVFSNAQVSFQGNGMDFVTPNPLPFVFRSEYTLSFTF
jgi:hypothetical protein